jgi:hypothetical protein
VKIREVTCEGAQVAAAPVSSQLEALARICHRLGGQLAIVSGKDFFTILKNAKVAIPLSEGSRFEYGIHWEKKIVYAMRGTTHVGFIIHEAGHVFADRCHPDDDGCDEWSWLGWEIAVARRIGVWDAWSQQSAKYYLGDGIDSGAGKDKAWWELSAGERRAVVADRIAHAKQIGVLSKSGTPKSVR